MTVTPELEAMVRAIAGDYSGPWEDFLPVGGLCVTLTAIIWPVLIPVMIGFAVARRGRA